MRLELWNVQRENVHFFNIHNRLHGYLSQTSIRDTEKKPSLKWRNAWDSDRLMHITNIVMQSSPWCDRGDQELRSERLYYSVTSSHNFVILLNPVHIRIHLSVWEDSLKAVFTVETNETENTALILLNIVIFQHSVPVSTLVKVQDADN